MTIHDVDEASSLIHEEAHEDANIIFGAVIDEGLHDEVRITVIATGFAERSVAAEPGGKVVEMPRAPRSPSSPSWRRPAVVGPRAEMGDPLEEDLDVPAFLRRQAD